MFVAFGNGRLVCFSTFSYLPSYAMLLAAIANSYGKALAPRYCYLSIKNRDNNSYDGGLLA